MIKHDYYTTNHCNCSSKNHFKKLREQKGWNQAELSEQFKNIGFNISQQVISKYESKTPKTSPHYTKEVISAYCSLFKTSADYLLGFTDYPGKDFKYLRDISEKTKLSPQAIKNLRKYDSGFLNILDNLICTANKEYPDYTGLLEVLLKTLWDFGNRTGTSEIKLITPGIKPETITEKTLILELLKRKPLEIFDLCLLVASQTQADFRNKLLTNSLVELKAEINKINTPQKKEGD